VKRIKYSRRSVSDLEEIGSYTLGTWGEDQANRYLDQLERFLTEALANNPEMGRPCDDVRPGLRRIECSSHVIFYRLTETTIVVSRILHQHMLPENYIGDED
jgi:toxin ParE1/3/4